MGIGTPPALGEEPGPVAGPVELPSCIGKGFGFHFESFQYLLFKCECEVGGGDLDGDEVVEVSSHVGQHQPYGNFTDKALNI